MSILFSRQCEYALQALSFLALKPEGAMVPIRTLSKSLGIPYHFLGKILQDLVLKGLLVSQKGPTGGFALAKPAERITLLDIVEAIDGLNLMHDCVMGFSSCSATNPCSAHGSWSKLRENVHEMLKRQNIGEMSKGMKKAAYASAR